MSETLMGVGLLVVIIPITIGLKKFFEDDRKSTKSGDVELIKPTEESKFD